MSRAVAFLSILVLISAQVAMAADNRLPQPAPGRAQASQPAASQPAGPPPKYRCDEKEFNFGTVWGGDKVEHAFIVHNDGEGMLTLEARGTCGCTIVDYDKTIKPGGQGKVNAVLTTGAYAAPLRKTITVTTNDPNNKQGSLTLVGNTKMLIASEPPLGAHYGQDAPGMNYVKTFKLTNNSDKPMKLEIVPPSTPTVFKVTSKEIEPGKVAELSVQAVPPFNEDVNSAQFRIKTGIEKAPELMLPCSITRPPTLQVNPPMVRLPQIPLSSPFRAPVTVRNNSADPIKVTSVECNDPKIKAELVETEANKLYTINVEVPVDFTPDPARQALLTIRTDYKPRPTLTVPLLSMMIPPRPPASRPVAVTAESLIGQPAPAMTGQTPEGQQIKFGNGTNEVTVVNFWAPWCTQSRTAMPKLDELYQKYRRKGVSFVNVAVEQLRPASEVAQAARELDSKVPIVVDSSQSIARAYGVYQFPMMFLIGKNGIVEAVRRGVGREPADLGKMNEAISEQIDKLLEGKTRNDFVPRPVFIGPTCGLQAYPIPANASSGAPMIYVESLRFDAGFYKPKTQAQYKVYFRNTGGAPLEVKAITAGGNLKIDPAYPKTLAPGATATVNCSFQAPAQPIGEVMQIGIETNDPMRPMLNIAVIAASKSIIEVQPAEGIDFANQARKFSVPRLAMLIYNGSGTVEYKAPKSSSPKFEATLKTSNSTVAILKVDAKPPFDQGRNNAIITVETNQPEQPIVQIPVLLVMPHRIEVNPTMIAIGPSQAVQQFSVSIVNSGDTPINVLEVKKSKPEIQTQFFPEPDGMSYRLQISVPAGFTAAPEGEKITVRTDDKEYGEIVIPLRSSNPLRARMLRTAATRPQP